MIPPAEILFGDPLGRRINERSKIKSGGIVRHRAFLPPDERMSFDRLGFDDNAVIRIADDELASHGQHLLGWAVVGAVQDTKEIGEVEANPGPHPFHAVLINPLPSDPSERRDEGIARARTLAALADFRSR